MTHFFVSDQFCYPIPEHLKKWSTSAGISGRLAPELVVDLRRIMHPEQKCILNKIGKQKKQKFSELVRKMLDEQIKNHHRLQLTAAAKALLADYSVDKELTVFTALDG